MLKYLETTTVILAWCLLLSGGGAAFWYARAARTLQKTGRTRPARSVMVLPALVIGPLALIAAFRVTGVNLLFGVHLSADWRDVLGEAFVPALVLVVASGLGGVVRRAVATELMYWRQKPFATVALAMGQSPVTALRRLVLAKALAEGWSRCLPWLFGELVIVETVFNAPGLGLDAWHQARTRDLIGLAGSIGWLAALYVTLVAATAMLHAWLGKRLASYA